MRLAIAMVVGTVAAHGLHLGFGSASLGAHAYWLPMTIAWIAKPGYGDTVAAVVWRLAGTIVGVVLTVAIFVVIAPGEWGTAVLIAAAAYLALIFIAANYAVAMTAYTIFVMALFAFGRAPIVTDLSRIVLTACAAAVVLVCSVMWPVRRSRARCVATCARSPAP